MILDYLKGSKNMV